MHCYKVYDQAVQISTYLDIPSISPQNPDYTVSVQEGSLSDHPITWVHDYDADKDSPLHRLGKIGKEYIVRFSGYADFLISEDHKLIRCFPASQAGSNTIEHLLLDQILPRVLSLKKSLVLHAGAIVCDSAAIGFAGKSGSGKSTLTTYLGRHGYPVLTDDCLVLEQLSDRFMALPSYPTMRLNPDTAKNVAECTEDIPKVTEYSSKLRLNQKHGGYRSHGSPVTLRALFILTEVVPNRKSQTVTLERCSLREAFSFLIRHMFRFDPTDKQCNIRDFRSLNEFVSTIPVYRLTYVQQYDVLGDVMRLTLGALKKTLSN